MRKKLAVLIAVITAAMMLFGCGGKDMSEYAGIEVGVDTVFDEFHFTLQDNGKVKLNVNGDETTGKWDETENGISIEDEMEFQKLDDNTLTYEVSGVTVHFARD